MTSARSLLPRKTRRIMIDLGLIVTGVAAASAFLFGRGRWLRNLLFISWLMMAVESLMGVSMAGVVFSMTMMDMIIAGAAVAVATNDPTRYDARAIGAISMALMPAHWVMAATHGAPNWVLYAAACNAGFVLQCLIVGGWLNGVGRRLGRLFGRDGAVRPIRGGGR